MNPLLDFSTHPRYDLITVDHVTPAMETLLAEGRETLARLTSDKTAATWEDFVRPLEDSNERLARAFGVVGHLHSVMDIPAWREAYNRWLPEVTRYWTEQGQNLALFAKYRALHESVAFEALTPARQKVVADALRDFRLSGAELPEADKPRFQAIQEELSALAAKFSENLLDATNAFVWATQEAADLAGLPADVIDAARASAGQAGEMGFRLSLQAPCYLPVMQYAESRALREHFYRAYAQRAAECADFGSRAEWNNTPLIARILELRAEEARLLGYGSYAEVSLAAKMADSPAQVAAFLRDLASRARPYAERDLTELKAYAAIHLGLEDLAPWDIAWASEKLRQHRYAFSEQEVRRYFPEPQVLSGLFALTQRLFGVTVREDRAPAWHDTVRFYRVEREGRLVGQFWLDLYARDTKRGGAWMDDAVTRRDLGAAVQTPVAYLNCNFSSPLGGRPATFTHDEVQTLFHEFGHGLHHLLTQQGDIAVSGINGVEWDAVELPSQFMENYCWEWSVLSDMTAHVESGEPLPRVLFDKMIEARNYQAGLQTLRQIEFALFDLRLHAEFDPSGSQTALDLLREVRDEVALIHPPAWHRFPNSFSHIFAGGYAAGYFSYKWAEVLSADAFAAFEEEGDPLDAITGADFCREILEAGGSRPAIDSFRAFRGRDPQVDALLRHNGMTD